MVRYGPKVLWGKTRRASTCPESNGRPNTPQPRTYSWPGHGGGPLPSGIAAVRAARLRISSSVAEGGSAVADPLPHRDGALDLGPGDQGRGIDLPRVQADRAHEVAATG